MSTPRLPASVNIPNQRLPSRAAAPRNPRGFGKMDTGLRSRGMEASNTWQFDNPAGEAPPDWPGTQPEWSIKWGLDRLGYIQDVHYYFEFNVGGLGASYYSQFDFVIPDYAIAIEVQGEYWHYGQGGDVMQRDEMRRVMAQGHDYTLIFIDEDDANERPIYMTEQALLGIDHSKSGKGI